MDLEKQDNGSCTRPQAEASRSTAAGIRQAMGIDEALSMASRDLPLWQLDVDSDGVVMSVSIDTAPTQFGDSAGKALADLFDPRARQLIKDTLAEATRNRTSAELTVPTKTACQCHLRIAPGAAGVMKCEISNLSLKHCMKNRIAKMQSLEAASLVASQVAHDINNKLTIVTGNLSLLELALDEKQVEGADECLRKAENAVGETKASVGRLRALAKCFELATEPVDLRHLAADVAGQYQAAGCNCKVEAPKDLHLVQGDRHLLTLAVNHLLMNAWEAGKNTEITITIFDAPNGNKLDTMLPEAPAVLLRVEDNGPGIAGDIARRIYQPFFTTKPDAQGIGLSIVRAIARRHEGTIRCVPEVDGGCFELLVPALHKSTTCDTTEIPANELHVLILDDDPSILEVTAEMLEMLGHKAIRSKDGISAIAKLKDEKAAGRNVDLVILDLVIHDGVGGVEALRRLREVQPGIPAIACSGQVTNPAVCDPDAFGFNAVLCKPYSVQALEAAVNSVILRVSPV